MTTLEEDIEALTQQHDNSKLTDTSSLSTAQDLQVAITLLLKKPTKLRILKFLSDREFATAKEIANEVNSDGGPQLSYCCVINNLRKLAGAQILHHTRSPIDTR